jgi:hypothetical protein
MRRLFFFGSLGLMLMTLAPAKAEVPLPPVRPEGIGQEGEPAPTEVPLPPVRPDGLEAAAPGVVAPTPVDEAAQTRGAEERAACLERLAQSGARAEPAPAIEKGACGAKHPIRLIGLPDALEVSPPAIVTCAVAEALMKWAVEAVKPEGERHLAVAPSRILIGTSYECRGRNRQPGAKLSEHAFANGVDVMGFAFRKRPNIAIGPRPGEDPEALFQAALRQNACIHFSTVLGPGSDAAHANHFHLDMRGRRPGVRICQ